MQIFLPVFVLKRKNPINTNMEIITKKDRFNFEGGNIELYRNDKGINSVAKRFPVFPLNLPETRPSINGIIAAEIIKDVNKKSALNLIFKNAENIVINDVVRKHTMLQINIAKNAGRFCK